MKRYDCTWPIKQFYALKMDKKNSYMDVQEVEVLCFESLGSLYHCISRDQPRDRYRRLSSIDSAVYCQKVILMK